MKFLTQRRLAASILKTSPQKVWFDPAHLGDIKDAITKNDVRGLIVKNIICKVQTVGYSHGRTRAVLKQKRKGRRQGHGSIKGSRHARLSKKAAWAARIRAQRKLLKALREQGSIPTAVYARLYSMAKGGFFRSRHHINLYIEEHGLVQGKNEPKKESSSVSS
ncbi:MAG TPA: 50S ribosomal protein L19e [Candidatus Nanoarchaeia archaeon]|nr:50S ribosomal protein L19e [Candidatus Nanoarchaeia archaeon]